MNRAKLTIFSILLVLNSFIIQLTLGAGCCNVYSKYQPHFKLLASNAQSTKTVLTRKRISDVEKCKDFAELKRALAFNFETFRDRNFDDDLHDRNCIVLECPEIGNLRSLENATGAHYFSAYNNNNTYGNVSLSCVPKVGLFIVSNDSLNFTEARDTCKAMNASLADVSNQERTEGLSLIIGALPVYVGLSNHENNKVWTTELGNPLSCYDYRAWGEGQPSNSRGCVGLYRPDIKTLPVWIVVPCDSELQYICEIPPFYIDSEQRTGQFSNVPLNIKTAIVAKLLKFYTFLPF